MGSVKFDGVLFVAYSNDHSPRHVHGFAAETEVIVGKRTILTYLLKPVLRTKDRAFTEK